MKEFYKLDTRWDVMAGDVYGVVMAIILKVHLIFGFGAFKERLGGPVKAPPP
jgi:hypothetical protein